jgi:hypothetical protein
MFANVILPPLIKKVKLLFLNKMLEIFDFYAFKVGYISIIEIQ